MTDEENINRTIAIPQEAVDQLEEEFPALLNFQERLRYSVQFTLKHHENSLTPEDIEDILETILDERD